jgi:diphthine synthase
MSVRALEELRSADAVYAEFYTSRLIDSGLEDIERAIGKKVILLDRKGVEESEDIVEKAKEKRVAFIAAGDTMSATTHVELRMRAEEAGVRTSIIHGVSVFTACASALGLQPYKFGRTVTLPLPEGDYFPTSPYDKILENKERGLHTLILLDIKEAEGRYMTAAQGAQWLLEAEKRVGKGLIAEKTLLCAAARLGSRSETARAGWAPEMAAVDMGPPLHTLVLPGNLHFLEAEALVRFAGAPREILQ